VRGGIWGIVLAVAAVGEYVVDVLPNTPSRTQAMGLSGRVISGASVGWMIATMRDGSGMFGAIAGIAGAVIGAYVGHAARLAAIAHIGHYPAAIVEDLVAIGLVFHRHTLGPVLTGARVSPRRKNQRPYRTILALFRTSARYLYCFRRNASAM
jgi:hypothetical protein